jgi:hypothetical protein
VRRAGPASEYGRLFDDTQIPEGPIMRIEYVTVTAPTDEATATGGW